MQLGEDETEFDRRPRPELLTCTVLHCGENAPFELKVSVHRPVAHAELIAKYRRAEADAAHKLGLIKVAGPKGLKAIQTATVTAAKAAKRRDGFAAKLDQLGVDVGDRSANG